MGPKNVTDKTWADYKSRKKAILLSNIAMSLVSSVVIFAAPTLQMRHLQRTYSAIETGAMQGLEKHNLTRITNAPPAFLIQL